MSSAPNGWVDTSRSGPPASEVHIDASVARSLVAAQLPHLADATIGDRFDGWDMAVFRLGEDHAIRLPRTQPAVTSLAVEERGLERLAPAWSFPHPRVIHEGSPTDDFPWPWAVTTWLRGDTADFHPLRADAGPSVGRALAEVHAPATPETPYNVEQSIPLAERGETLGWAMALVAEKAGPDGQRLDVTRARELWNLAMEAPEPDDKVWSHADCHGSNLLSDGGDFAGIIDWGKMAGCDRAVDLAFLYTAMPADGVAAAFAAYREATGIDDDGLDARARGIAVAKAASWATLDREANVVMAWRAFEGLGVLAR